MLLASLATGIDASVTLGDGMGSIGASAHLDPGPEDSMKRSITLGFDPGPLMSAKAEGRIYSGSGPLDEQHSITNEEGDYARVRARLEGSRSWVFTYNLESHPSEVSAREWVRVDRGTGLAFTGAAGNERGDLAEVYALGGEGCDVSMGYSNRILARGDAARADQRVLGASSEDRECPSFLIIGGNASRRFAGTDPRPLDWYAGVEAEVLGGSGVRSAISVESGGSGARASQVLTAGRFDEMNSSGLSESCPQKVTHDYLTSRYAFVEAGAVEGHLFSSRTLASASIDAARAGQKATARGEQVYKSSLAGNGYDSQSDYFNLSAGTGAIAQDGGFIRVRDIARAEGEGAGIHEDLTVSGLVHREIFAVVPDAEETGPRFAYADVDIMGLLRGGGAASATTDSAIVQGRLQGIPGAWIYGRSAIAGNATDGVGIFVLMAGSRPFNEHALATDEIIEVV